MKFVYKLGAVLVLAFKARFWVAARYGIIVVQFLGKRRLDGGGEVFRCAMLTLSRFEGPTVVIMISLACHVCEKDDIKLTFSTTVSPIQSHNPSDSATLQRASKGLSNSWFDSKSKVTIREWIIEKFAKTLLRPNRMLSRCYQARNTTRRTKALQPSELPAPPPPSKHRYPGLIAETPATILGQSRITERRGKRTANFSSLFADLHLEGLKWTCKLVPGVPLARTLWNALERGIEVWFTALPCPSFRCV